MEDQWKCFMLVSCLSLASITMVLGDEVSISKVPKLETAWTAVYNASDTVTNSCGKLYASYFLQQFLKTQPMLYRKCGSGNTTISIASVARVRILHYQPCHGKHCDKKCGQQGGTCKKIQLSTFLTFDGSSASSVKDCVSHLNTTFHNIDMLANVSVIHEDPVHNCSKAVLNTNVLAWDESGCRWKCKENWALIGKSATCSSLAALASKPVSCQLKEAERCKFFVNCIDRASNTGNLQCDEVKEALQCLRKERKKRPRIYTSCWGDVKSMLIMFMAEYDDDDCTIEAVDTFKPAEICTTTDPTTTLTTTTTPTTTIPTTTTPTTTTEKTTTTTATDPTTTTTATATTMPTTIAGPMDWQVNLTEADGVVYKNGKPTLMLHEGETKNITINTWANVTTLCGDDPYCILYILLTFDTNPSVNDFSCTNGTREEKVIDQVVVGFPISSAHTFDKDNFCKVEYFSGITYVPQVHTNPPLRVVFTLRGRSDFTYDNSTVGMNIVLMRELSNGSVSEHSRQSALDIEVIDGDRKAICQSINDPHITTFDGLPYDNFRHGEHVAYRHKTLPFQVNIVYQHCSAHVDASCNCAVAIKSGDDVIVFDRCFLKKQPFKNLNNTWVVNNKTILMVDLYLNGELTPGTSIREADEGLKYFVFLPTGTYIKIKTSGELLNVWILGSPQDWRKTEGLCGTYNGNPDDDLTMPDGTVQPIPVNGSYPTEFNNAWKVELYGKDSLLLGVENPGAEKGYKAEEWSVCSEDPQSDSRPAANGDVNMCKILEGKDVTDFYVKRAISGVAARQQQEILSRRRRKRQTSSIKVIEPIDITPNFQPPIYKWSNQENAIEAQTNCSQHIRMSTVGQLCAMIPNVNFEQEVNSCVKDIKITKTMDWADAAQDAMTEQCLEELKRNSSIDPSLIEQITNAICPNKCSYHGTCTQGKCLCHADYSGVDCSASTREPPDTFEMKNFGLCNTKINDCSRVIVYGDNFIQSTQLVCLLTETILEFKWYTLGKMFMEQAMYINFNSVECIIPKLMPYVISVSNDNGTTRSEPLLFIPYNGKCLQCSTSAKECNLTKNTCVIENQCYASSEVNPRQECNVCRPQSTSTAWSTLPDCNLSVDVVIAIATIVGSVIGIAVGILLYIICCRRSSKPKSIDDYNSQSGGHNGFKPAIRPVSNERLHRNREFHPSQFPQNLDSRHREYQEPYMQNYGQGVENGVDDTTYF